LAEDDSSKNGKRWFVTKFVLPIVGVAVLAGLFFAVVVVILDRNEEAELNLEVFGGSKITFKSVTQLRVPFEDLSGLDKDRYYVDEQNAFAYAKPQGSTWTAPKHFEGFEGLFEEKGVVLADSAVPQNAPAQTPFEDMVRNVEITRFSSPNELRVEFGPSSVAETPAGTFDVRQLRRANVASEFMVSVFEKRRLQREELSLPAFFALLPNLDPSAVFDRLEARSGVILAGASFRYKDVLVDNEESDLAVHRALVFTENSTRFFIAEAAYSPQTEAPLEEWNELQDVLKSFRISEAR
jgi:hypothetical protein